MKKLDNRNICVLIFGKLCSKVTSLVVFLTAIILSSCGQASSNINDIEILKSNHTDDFVVKIALIAEEPDVIDFFYALDSLNEKFSESKKIRKPLIGGEKLEIIEFLLKDNKAIKFRLDLGRNLKQKGIKIDYIKIQNDKRTLLVDGHLIKYFFNENRYMNFFENEMIYFVPNNRKTPFMTSSALLNKKMKIEF